VALHAHRPAVRFDGVELDYRTLHERSCRIAARVRELAGNEPAAIVLLLPQGIDLVAAILGVLEAGHWYVPLDLGASPDVLHDLVRRSEASLVLANESSLGLANAAAGGACAVARVDEQAVGDAPSPAETPCDPGALAYVYFTSGTTGAPKGVTDTHRNVLHNVLRYTNGLRFAPEDRMTLVQAAHFSGAASNVFGALLNGSLLLPYDVARGGAGAPLARWIERERPTILHSVPSLFRSVCVDGARFASLRLVRIEGDAGAPGDAERFARHFEKGSVLVHGLGATETGIVRQYFLAHGERVPGDVLPLGYPVEDIEVEIHDEGHNSVPAGTVGEIVVRSHWLSPGYWRDLERTAAAFQPAAQDPSLREYHTGDLGRLREDGCLEHLGRRDLQTKIRGQWVNVAAVEAAIAAMHGVEECAVAPLRVADGESVLAAFLVCAKEEPPPTLRALRRALAESLPAHAVPAKAFVVDALPLGPHAKLDRRSLDAGLGRALPDGAGAAAARNETEETLVRIWRQVLSLERVGIFDPFVELGGDSLSAIAVATAIERNFGVMLSPSALAESPTIADLAARVTERNSGSANGALVPLRSSGAHPPLFCVHDLESDAFLFSPLAHRLGMDQPVYGLRLPAGGPVAELPRTIEALAARYLRDVDAVAPRGPYRLAGFCFGGVVALEMARLLATRGKVVSQLVLLNVTAFDLFALVSPAAQRRFRNHWLARMRYLRRKRDALRWVTERVARELRDMLWRTRLGAELARPDSGRAASPALARAVGRRAFRAHVAQPHQGPLMLCLADETLPLYADDPAEAWAALTRGPIELHRFPHDGYAMLIPPDVDRLAAMIGRRHSSEWRHDLES